MSITPEITWCGECSRRETTGEMVYLRTLPTTGTTRKSKNAAYRQPQWAVNLHGFFAGGDLYRRESEMLALHLGWSVLTPDLPGFAATPPLRTSEDVSAYTYAEAVLRLLDYLEVPSAVIVGHSMGGAVAVALADLAPERVVGIVYRDGIATPSWRSGYSGGQTTNQLLARLGEIRMATILGAKFMAEIPSLAYAGADEVSAAAPVMAHNLRHLSGPLAAWKVLFETDLSAAAAAASRQGIPMVQCWGVGDRLTPPATAEEFRRATGAPIRWMLGGHGWMFTDAEAQSLALRNSSEGREFLAAVRRRTLTGNRRASSFREGGVRSR